jgi:hypothetical protein
VSTAKRKLPIAIRVALITGVFGIIGYFVAGAFGLFKSHDAAHQSNNLTARNVDKSAVMQGVSMANTGVVGSATVQGSENTVSVDSSLKQLFQTNGGQIQGQINAPAQVVNVTQVFNNNYENSNPANTELHEWITNFEAKYEATTNDLQLTKKNVSTLISALKDLDEKTSAIEVLPDGRTEFGGVIAGNQHVYFDAADNAIKSFFQGNYAVALEYARTGIQVMESSSSRPNVSNEYISYTPLGKALCYYWAAMSAQRLTSNSIANEYALKAVGANPSADNKQMLVTTMGNLAVQKFKEQDFSNAFYFGESAFTNYESIRNSITNSWNIPTNDLWSIYVIAGSSAQLIGRTNEAKLIMDKAEAIRPKQ